MPRVVNIDQLKQEYIGKEINRLTIIDIYRDEHNKIVCLCKCRCGNTSIVSKKSLFCKQPPMSCGCYRSESRVQYYKDHPELRDKLSSIKKRHYIEHPEAAQKHSDKLVRLYNKEPDRRLLIGKRISEWFKNNKDEVEKWADHRRQYYKDHPELGEARSQLYRDHPEILQKISDGNKEYNKSHPEKVTRTNSINREICLNKRVSVDYRALLQIIHPDDIDGILSGSTKADDLIRTRCPVCGNYAAHAKTNVFVISKCDFKYGNPPLCKQCHVNLTSCLTSEYEDNVAKFISTFYDGECIRNNRDILSGKELDLYYPEKKIAIEFNGDYWHSELFKDKDYHYNKFKLCRDQCILLISIFESEWVTSESKIKNYIVDTFNGTENELSFCDNHTKMNNNYPSPNLYSTRFEVVENYYTFKDNKVYTSGYSIIE